MAGVVVRVRAPTQALIQRSWAPPVSPPGSTSLGVALVGPVNSGKSSLLNALLGAKVSITSPRAQTTRERVLGVLTKEKAQLVFSDTPGILSALAERKKRFQPLQHIAAAVSCSADVTVSVVDATVALRDTCMLRQALPVAEEQERQQADRILVLNKLDLLRHKRQVLPLVQQASELGVFQRVFMVSASTGDGVPHLADYLVERSVPATWLYPPDLSTSQSDVTLVQECVREKLLRQLHGDLPYLASFDVLSWIRHRDGSLRIDMDVVVGAASQKSIIIGARAHRIRAIGSAARRDLEQHFGTRVHLFLNVKHAD